MFHQLKKTIMDFMLMSSIAEDSQL